MKRTAALAIILAAAAIALAAQTDREKPVEPVEIEQPLIAGATAELAPTLPEPTTSDAETAPVQAVNTTQVVETPTEVPTEVAEDPKKNYQKGNYFSEDELNLFAATVEAEAGNQGEQGMRYVADVILNRLDSEDWPDTITGVVTQHGQFAVYPKAIWKHMPPADETKRICLEEAGNRCDSEIIMFRTEHFHPWGTPKFKYKAHYFSAK